MATSNPVGNSTGPTPATDPLPAVTDSTATDTPEDAAEAPDTAIPPASSAAQVSTTPAVEKWPGWPGNSVFRLIVPVLKVGSIIGRKGEFVKKICEETRARIRVLDGPVGSSDRIVLISGKEEPDAKVSPAMNAALRVFKRVTGLSEGEGDGTVSAATGAAVCSIRLLVASTQAIYLIGKQGSIIKSIQESSGASIRVLSRYEVPFYVTEDERIVEIQGDSLKVLKALEAVVENLRKFLVDHSVLPLFEKALEPQIQHSSGLSFYGHDSGTPGVRPSGHGPTAAALVTQVTQKIQIPLSYAEDIIGVGGSNIMYIRRTSGATLTIKETLGLPDEITVEIKGTSSEVEMAQHLIEGFISGHKEPSISSYSKLDAHLRPYSTTYPSSSTLTTQSIGGYGSSGFGGGYGSYRL